MGCIRDIIGFARRTYFCPDKHSSDGHTQEGSISGLFANTRGKAEAHVGAMLTLPSHFRGAYYLELYASPKIVFSISSPRPQLRGYSYVGFIILKSRPAYIRFMSGIS